MGRSNRKSEPHSNDSRFKDMKITPLKIFCTVVSIFLYITDIAFDIFVAYKHYNDGNNTYFYLTVFLIIFPAIVMDIFTLWWYFTDKCENVSEEFKVSPTQWFIRIVFLLLLMAPVLRNCEALYYANQNRNAKTEAQRKNFVRRMAYENLDASYLRLIEAFLECAPQVILQIYIIAQAQYDKPDDFSFTEIIQLISILTSLISMANSIVSYLRNLRESLDCKNELGCSSTAFLTLGQFFEISARVVTLGLFASLMLPYFFLLCGFHFGTMFIWIRTMDTNFCHNKYGEYIYNLVFSFIFIFCFINPKDNDSQKRYICYHILIFVENVTLISLWYHYCSSIIHFRLPAIIMVFVSFTLGVIIMIFYYIVLHPTRGVLIKMSHPKRENDIESSECRAQFAQQFHPPSSTIEKDLAETFEIQDTVLQNLKPEEINLETES